VPQKYLLYLGTIEPRKNVSGILAALEKIYEREPQWRNVHLVLAGGPGWANGHIWRQLKNSPYRDNFHYFGYITAEQKKTLIQGSLGLIWPSFYEGWGHPPAEAILLGKPVITSFSSSLPEIVKDKAIMIDPYN
jgi:glycosyltransferase involved in cell wall biosynthesis